MSAPAPVQLETGQLLLSPSVRGKANPVKRKGRFGSAGKGIFCQTFINDTNPKIRVILNGISLNGLLDTGTDVAIVSKGRWPLDRPLQTVSAMFTGVGTFQTFIKVL